MQKNISIMKNKEHENVFKISFFFSNNCDFFVFVRNGRFLLKLKLKLHIFKKKNTFSRFSLVNFFFLHSSSFPLHFSGSFTLKNTYYRLLSLDFCTSNRYMKIQIPKTHYWSDNIC